MVWVEWLHVFVQFLCLLVVSSGLAYVWGRHPIRFFPLWLGLAYSALSLWVVVSLGSGAERVDLWHGPDSPLVFALRLGAVGALTAYGMSTIRSPVICRSMSSLVLSVTLAGVAWGAVQLWVESAIYGLDEGTVQGVPYALLRLRMETAAQAAVALFSVASVLGLLAGLAMAGRNPREG